MLSLGSYFAAILSSNKSKAFQSKRMEFLPFFCKTSCHSNHCNKTFIAAIKQTTSKKVPKHFPHHKVHYIIYTPPSFLNTLCRLGVFSWKNRFLTPRVGSFHAFRWTPVFPQLQDKLLVQKGAPKKDCRKRRRNREMRVGSRVGGLQKSIFWWKI